MYIYIYIYDYDYEYIYMYTYTHTYGRFPRPASTKNAKVYNCCVRIPYQSNKHRGYMNKNIPHTTPRKHTMLSWPASGYA